VEIGLQAMTATMYRGHDALFIRYVLYERDNGEYKYQHKPREYTPVREYLALQKRFAHLTEEHIGKIQAFVDAKLKAMALPVPPLRSTA
jgi:pyruvate/2-oxoacid:ferredoxin oxidoreductase beta subunit